MMTGSREKLHMESRIAKLEKLADATCNPNEHERLSAATKLAELRSAYQRRYGRKPPKYPNLFRPVAGGAKQDITQRKGYYEIRELQKRIPALEALVGLQAAGLVVAWYAQRDISERDWQWIKEVINQ